MIKVQKCSVIDMERKMFFLVFHLKWKTFWKANVKHYKQVDLNREGDPINVKLNHINSEFIFGINQ